MNPPHNDRDWFLRLRPKSGSGQLLDICHYCPHVRGLHDASGCRSPSVHQFDPTPCACTNQRAGSLFANPGTLTQLTAHGNLP